MVSRFVPSEVSPCMKQGTRELITTHPALVKKPSLSGTRMLYAFMIEPSVRFLLSSTQYRSLGATCTPPMMYDSGGPDGGSEDRGGGKDISSIVSMSSEILPWFREDEEGGGSISGMMFEMCC
jgi:hypothetical protein